MSPAPLQGFEFESTFLLNTATFQVCGSLPVLPGPCQLIWWDHLYGQDGEGALDMYFRHLQMDSSKSDIIKTSTLLAEDRILSFAMILRSCKLQIMWVPGATFSYEPMMTWNLLLGQRRRWVNGTIAAYMYFLLEEKGIAECAMSGIRDITMLQSLWGLQLYQSFLQILSPAFFSIAIFEAMSKMSQKFPEVFTNYHWTIENGVTLNTARLSTVFYFAFYLSWVLLAMALGKKPNWMNKSLYVNGMEVVYWMYSLISVGLTCLVYYALFSEGGSALGINTYIIFLLWVVPFVLSLCLSLSSAFLFVLYGIPFLLQLPMYVCFIPAFAFARMHDLSWGNRDSNAHGEVDNKKKRIKENEFYSFTMKANFLLILGNACIAGGYVKIVETIGHVDLLLYPLTFCLFFPVFIQIFFSILLLFDMSITSIVFRMKRYVFMISGKEKEEETLNKGMFDSSSQNNQKRSNNGVITKRKEHFHTLSSASLDHEEITILEEESLNVTEGKGNNNERLSRNHSRENSWIKSSGNSSIYIHDESLEVKDEKSEIDNKTNNNLGVNELILVESKLTNMMKNQFDIPHDRPNNSSVNNSRPQSGQNSKVNSPMRNV